MARAKKLTDDQLELLQKLQPSYWRTKTERKRYLKTLAGQEKELGDLTKGGWLEKQGDDFVPTTAGFAALMLGDQVD